MTQNSNEQGQNLVKEVKDGGLNKARTFILYFHFRHAAPQTKVFEFTGDLRAAAERASKYCKIMNYRYIKVRPFIVDLDEDEKRRNEEGYFEGNEL